MNDTNHDATDITHDDETHNSFKEPVPTSVIQTADKIPGNTSKFKRRAIKRCLARQLKRNKSAQENALLDNYITWAEDEITALVKWDTVASKFAAR